MERAQGALLMLLVLMLAAEAYPIMAQAREETFELEVGTSKYIYVGGKEVIITLEEKTPENIEVSCSIDGFKRRGVFRVGDIIFEDEHCKITLENIRIVKIGEFQYIRVYLKVSGNFVLRKWMTTTLDSEGTVGLDTSIALDSQGYPHIAYTDWTNRDLKYAWWDGSRWRIERVDWKGSVGRHASLALDAQDRPRIAYMDTINYDVKYARWDGSSWRIERVDEENDVGFCVSMALDSLGRPHLAYWDFTSHWVLKHAWLEGGRWRIEVVDNLGVKSRWPEKGLPVGLEISIALDGQDLPHVSYCIDVDGEAALKYAKKGDIGWMVKIVDNDGFSYRWVSMALDGGGKPHIVYYTNIPLENVPIYDSEGRIVGWSEKSPGEMLEYARWTDLGWRFEVIDNVSSGGSPPGPAIAFDSGGNPHIAYLYLRSMLKYARWIESEWKFEIVDNEGWVGGETSLALDENDRPHISYYDYDHRDLKYATLSEAVRPIEPQPKPMTKVIAAISVAAAIVALGILWRRWRG